jgi:hypothetical protein
LKVKKLRLQLRREDKLLHKVNQLVRIHPQLISNLELLIWEVSDNSLKNLTKISHQKKYQIN